MKSVLISIRPKWCELIASGRKTIEVRKTKPQIVTPFKVYIYQSKKRGFERATYSDGKVIGEFVCDKIIPTAHWRLCGETGKCAKRTEMETAFPELACLTLDEIRGYAGSNQRIVYGLHISNLVIYEKPKKVSDFKKYNRTCYYDHLGLATQKCKDCKKCHVDRPPQSWCYVETLE